MADEGTAQAGAGQGEGGGAPNGGQPSGAAEGQGGSPHDYEAQIRSNGEFAVSEIKNQNRRADRAEASYRKLVERLGGENSQLLGFLEQQGVTAETLVGLIQDHAALLQNPQGREMLQRFKATGEIGQKPGSRSQEDAGGDADDLDDFDPVMQEVKSLKSTLSQVQQGMSGMTLSQGKAALQGHLEKLRTDLALEGDAFVPVAKYLGEYIQKLAPNDPATLNLMRQIQNPDGYKTVRALALSHIADAAPEILEGLGERRRLRQNREVSRFETDFPTGEGDSGRELPSELLQKNAGDVVQFFIDHPEHL